MDNLDEHIAFCFQCAAKNQYTDPQPPHAMLNPYPGLISNDWSIAQSQPLINTVYNPASISIADIANRRLKQKGKPQTKSIKTQSLIDFEDFFTWFHEWWHLIYFSRTPAKDLAKLHLAIAYDSLFLLFSTETSSEIEYAWNRFKNAQTQLHKIFEKIAFVEELLATVYAFNTIRKHELVPEGLFAGFQEECKKLEQKALWAEEQHFHGFTDAYNRFQRLLRAKPDHPLLDMLTISQLSQSIELTKVWVKQPSLRFQAIDAKENLDRFLTLAEDTIAIDKPKFDNEYLVPMYYEMATKWQMLRKIMIINTDPPEIIRKKESWIQFEEQEIYFPIIISAILLISSNKFNENTGDYMVENELEYSKNHSNTRYAIFHPVVLRNKSYIKLKWSEDDEPRSNDFYFAHLSLLLFEAIRQQIEARKGIICPFNIVNTSKTTQA